MSPPKHTEEQRELIAKLWERGLLNEEIIRRVNALSGPAVDERDLRRISFRLGARRPQWFKQQVASAASKIKHGALAWSKDEDRLVRLMAEAGRTRVAIAGALNEMAGFEKRTAKSVQAHIEALGLADKPAVEQAPVVVRVRLSVPRKKYRAPAPIDPAPYAGTRRVSQAVGYRMGQNA